MQQQAQRLINHYRQALKIKPDNYSLYEKIAQLYYKIDRLDLALEVCQIVLQCEPNLQLNILPVLANKLGLEEEEFAHFRNHLISKVDIKTIYQDKLEKAPILPNIRKWKDIQQLFQQQKYSESIAACFHSIENDLSLPWPHLYLNGIVFFLDSSKTSYLEQISNFYRQILQESSVSPEAYIVLGNALTKQGRITEAIFAFKTGMDKRNYFSQYNSKLYDNLKKVSQVHFLIIGIGKGGTSSLYHYLSQYPNVIPPSQKELHFFNKNFELGLEWYLAQFPLLPEGDIFLTGEATPWYLVSQGVAAKVRQFFPKIKLIAVLRNPVTRAISQYYMNQKVGRESRSLEVALTSEMSTLSKLTNLDQVSSEFWQTENAYLLFSLYFYFLKQWMATFPREQFLIIRSEDLYSQTAQTMQQVYNFLGIPDYPLAEYPNYNAGSYPQVSSELRQNLADFFRPHNQKLEEYLGMNFNWE